MERVIFFLLASVFLSPGLEYNRVLIKMKDGRGERADQARAGTEPSRPALPVWPHMSPGKGLDRQPSHTRWPVLATGEGHSGEGAGAFSVASCGAVLLGKALPHWSRGTTHAAAVAKVSPGSVVLSTGPSEKCHRCCPHLAISAPIRHKDTCSPGGHGTATTVHAGTRCACVWVQWQFQSQTGGPAGRIWEEVVWD